MSRVRIPPPAPLLRSELRKTPYLGFLWRFWVAAAAWGELGPEWNSALRAARSSLGSSSFSRDTRCSSTLGPLAAVSVTLDSRPRESPDHAGRDTSREQPASEALSWTRSQSSGESPTRTPTPSR